MVRGGGAWSGRRSMVREEEYGQGRSMVRGGIWSGEEYGQGRRECDSPGLEGTSPFTVAWGSKLGKECVEFVEQVPC